MRRASGGWRAAWHELTNPSLGGWSILLHRCVLEDLSKSLYPSPFSIRAQPSKAICAVRFPTSFCGLQSTISMQSMIS
jgi:hypothetical protein